MSRPGDPVDLLREGKYLAGLVAAFEDMPALGSKTCADVHLSKIKANKVRFVPREEVCMLKSPHQILYTWYWNAAISGAFNAHIGVAFVPYLSGSPNGHLIIATLSEAANSR